MNKLLIILFISFLSNIANAEQKIFRHMPPLKSEELISPIKLKCGLKITEWRESLITKYKISKLNKLCALAKSNFNNFIKNQNLKANKVQLNFSMSLIPDSEEYRGLNDISYRFYDRQYQDPVWAYTSYDFNYIFIINDTELNNFSTIFTHEIFHALSMSSGIFDSHPGDKYAKYAADERLAIKFTQYLGFSD